MNRIHKGQIHENLQIYLGNVMKILYFGHFN